MASQIRYEVGTIYGADDNNEMNKEFYVEGKRYILCSIPASSYLRGGDAVYIDNNGAAVPLNSPGSQMANGTVPYGKVLDNRGGALAYALIQSGGPTKTAVYAGLSATSIGVNKMTGYVNGAMKAIDEEIVLTNCANVSAIEVVGSLTNTLFIGFDTDAAGGTNTVGGVRQWTNNVASFAAVGDMVKFGSNSGSAACSNIITAISKFSPNSAATSVIANTTIFGAGAVANVALTNVWLVQALGAANKSRIYGGGAITAVNVAFTSANGCMMSMNAHAYIHSNANVFGSAIKENENICLTNGAGNVYAVLRVISPTIAFTNAAMTDSIVNTSIFNVTQRYVDARIS